MKQHDNLPIMEPAIIKKAYLLFIFLLFIVPYGNASYNLRQYSSRDGLSNSAILSLCQDCKGEIWIGSCDGLNIYDGTYLGVYKSTNPTLNFSGNQIEGIVEADNNIIWIQTNLGLDRFDVRKQTIESFPEFRYINRMARSPKDDFFILKDDGYIWCYQPDKKEFYRLETEKFHVEKVYQIAVDSYGILWVFSDDNDNRSYRIQYEDNLLKLIPCHYLNHQEKILRAFVEGELLYFIDDTYAFYECELASHRIYYIADLEEEIKTRGEVSSAIKSGNDYFIGFKSGGLIQLNYLPESKVKYRVSPIAIQSGVFCLMKDRFQDIIWVGTDGQGIYMCFTDEISVQNILLDTPEFRVNNPVRALYLDHEQTLWIGTKGGGILRILNFHPDMKSQPQTERILSGNSALMDNSVYSFAPSRKKHLWIGTEKGLNYYSYAEKRVKAFPVVAGGKEVKYVHSICELNDTTLWLVSVSEGIVKILLDSRSSANAPKVKSAERFVLDNGKRASNYFWGSFQENDSILWFANRGHGPYRMNVRTNQLTPHPIDTTIHNQMANDVFAIYKNDKGYWFGTSMGLIHLHQGKIRTYNKATGFPNSTVHGILEGERQILWVSTNQGIVRFNVNNNTVQTYRQQGDMQVTEFSDDAFFKDSLTGTLFFGGTNGFVTIREYDSEGEAYMPPLFFNRLSVFGKECNLYDFLKQEGKEVLELDYSQNFFSLSFAVIDYINGNNYTYSYKIDGLSNSWIENGLSTTAAFSNLAPGEYTLLVKYRSNITGKESKAYPLLIRILPPWYMTSHAYMAYFLVFIAIAYRITRMLHNRYHRKRRMMLEQMNLQQREEVYESKLRFFTNITHEFCTPLTLINGPCEKILSYQKVDDYVRKYAAMIQQNAQKLNALILELIEFRRLETGHKVLQIRNVAVSKQVRSIAESFGELIENHQLDYRLQIQEGVCWNTDAGCLSKIANNLISNAFKYTPERGNITVELFVQTDGQLCLRISNSGKGIKEEELNKVFDRYKVLDNFEVQRKDGIAPRNGLGLAICHSMVTLLHGQIHVSSIPNQITTFEVLLPPAELPEGIASEQPAEEPPVVVDKQRSNELENTPSDYDKSRQTIMVIDDDPSMLWFVTEIFVEQYNVISLNSAEEALSELSVRLPDLIISDVMMPGIDGKSFARKIKSDKQTGRIPLILLSALNTIDEQTQGIESGAEAYVTKPFNVDYLEKVAKRLLQREEDLKEYYTSILSTFELENGHFLHKEDKAFFESVMQSIDNHIQYPNFKVEDLSAQFGYSTRQFYRKLKTITDKSPSDLIREYRLNVVERLLLTTQLSMEEIMDKTGFGNKGTFYKQCAHHFGMSPGQYREMKRKESQESISQ